MFADRCTLKFPRHFCDKTELSHGGYPIYRRRDDGRSARVTRKGVTDWPLHNGHITPYNPALLLKYQCHLNVEVCATVDAVKYIHKYICKGHDVALLKV
jgi:hypothetical protein